MFDQCDFSSNFFSCSPTNITHSSFDSNAASLVEQYPKGDFNCDSAFIASALFSTPSPKRQCLEPISAHEIQNRFGTLCGSLLSSSLPLELSLSESTLRSFHLQQYISDSQASSQDYIPSETLGSSQSQLSYSAESDNIKSDGLFARNYGTLILPETQLLSSDIELQHQRFQDTPRGEWVADKHEKTDLSDLLFNDLSQQPGLFSNTNITAPGTSIASAPPILIAVQNPVERGFNQFSHSHTTPGRIQTPMEDKPVSLRRQLHKINHSSGNDTAKIKRFSCPECGHKFARAFNLQTHIATHTGTRPFSCPADGCSKAFSRRHDLGRHISAVHHEWLAIKNLSVAEAVKLLHWKKDKHITHGRCNSKKTVAPFVMKK